MTFTSKVVSRPVFTLTKDDLFVPNVAVFHHKKVCISNSSRNTYKTNMDVRNIWPIGLCKINFNVRYRQTRSFIFRLFYVVQFPLASAAYV